MYGSILSYEGLPQLKCIGFTSAKKTKKASASRESSHSAYYRSICVISPTQYTTTENINNYTIRVFIMTKRLQFCA